MDWADRISAAASPEATSLWHRLWTLESSYWAEVDLNAGRRAHEYYTEDAVYDLGHPGMRFEGRQAIVDFYAGHRDAPAHTVLHIAHNFALVKWSATTARAHSILTIYIAEGERPQVSAGPSVIATSENSYVTEGDVWKVSSRIHTPYFAGAQQLLAAQTSGPGDEQT